MDARSLRLAQDGEWPMYSGSYTSQRFSPLTQLTPQNVGRLRPMWVYQPPGTGSVEATPVVANGIMYVTAGPTMVAALDLRSGKTLWEWTRPIAASVLNLGFPRVNRGVAILDNMIYVVWYEPGDQDRGNGHTVNITSPDRLPKPAVKDSYNLYWAACQSQFRKFK